ncbi:TIGR01620 family protein [Vibrio sp. FNV 38]|nr:TIGR01620 family protein [Vibrio sp. FNV 38]
MKDYQPKTVFSDIDATEKANLEGVFEQPKQFSAQEKFVPVEIKEQDQQSAVDELDGIIRPKKKSSKWWSLGSATFVGLVGWQLVENVTTAFSAGDWLTLGWSGFVAALSTFGGVVLAKEWLKLKRLKGHFSIQEQTEQIIATDSVGKGVSFCKKLAKQSGIEDEYAPYERWRNQVQPTHSDAEILELYDVLVVAELDKQAVQVVTRHATESAALVAISPLAAADMLLVVWRNIKMINSLSEVYGIELGYWSRVRLLRSVFVNMAAAGASELAIDASMDMMSMDIAGKLSVRAGQGLGIGILTARLGLKSMELLRPMPWQAERRVTLGSIRKQIVSKVAKLTMK